VYHWEFTNRVNLLHDVRMYAEAYAAETSEVFRGGRGDENILFFRNRSGCVSSVWFPHEFGTVLIKDHLESIKSLNIKSEDRSNNLYRGE